MTKRKFTRSRLVEFGLSAPSELSESFTAIPIEGLLTLPGPGASPSVMTKALPAKKIVYGNLTAGEQALIDKGTKMLGALIQIMKDARIFWGVEPGVQEIAGRWNALCQQVSGVEEGTHKDAENVQVV